MDSNTWEPKKRRNPEDESAVGRLAALLARYRSLTDMRLTRALPKCFSCATKESRWRGANDSTQGHVRSPDLNRNEHDQLVGLRSKTC